MKKINTAMMVFGLFFVGAAVVLAGNMMGLWKITNYSGWWTVFIIAPGIAGLIQSKQKFGYLVLTAIGFLLLAKMQGWFETTYPVYAIVFFALLGVYLVAKSFSFSKEKIHDYNTPQFEKSETSDSFTSCSALFSGAEAVNSSLDFKGANLNATFGGVKLDLSNAVINGEAVIKCSAIFGGIQIFAPQNCKIVSNGTPILGGFENKYVYKSDMDVPVLKIEYTAFCGGVKVE